MKVILTKDVDTLGTGGDVVDVADGFARNYLIPRSMAVVATAGSMADLNRRIERIRAKAEKKYQDDLLKAEKIQALENLTLEANAGDTGKLYGTITTKELAKVLTDKTGLTLERRNLNVDKPINKVGDYMLHVKISAKVSTELPITVKAILVQKEAFVLEDAFADDLDETEE
ncbi:MAG: 50S ribosomal protein L9 [Candidatus Melainabacteria bacterium]